MVGYTSDRVSNQDQTRWLSWNSDGGLRGLDLARNPDPEYDAGEFPLPTRPPAGTATQSTSKNMEGLEYLVVEPACEVNEKGIREKNDGNEDVSIDDNEKIEVDLDEWSFAEEDGNDPEQNEIPKWTEPDQPMTTGTRKGDRKRTVMRYNRYADDFLIDKIQPEEIGEELVNIGDLVADE